MTLDDQADTIAAFYKRALAAGLPADVAGVMAIDANKMVMAGGVQPAKPAKRDINSAAAEKRARREAELAGQ